MTNTKPKGSVRRATDNKMSLETRVAATPGTLRKITGSTDTDRAAVLVDETLSSLWSPKDLSDAQLLQRRKAAVAALEAITPADELERMLAAQMVATHSALMDCFRRAMLEGQTFDGREFNLKHAEKLMAIYARQVEALDKHRGKGQQKITVEHVTVVSEGAQAIIGNVTAGNPSMAAKASSAGSAGAPTLTHDPAPLAPQIEIGEVSPVGAKETAEKVLSNVRRSRA